MVGRNGQREGIDANVTLAVASLAVAHPLVYRQPRVTILGSGDEIYEAEASRGIDLDALEAQYGLAKG